jgi:tRNA-modifying protein YgfZ
VKSSFSVDLGYPALLEFRGPDAVRFLNGQLTQDVKRVIGHAVSAPSCVTDAKGKLQFRVYLTESPDGALWISAPEGYAEMLEARLTRYLIADDVEVSDLSGKYRLNHVVGSSPHSEDGTFVREASRYGVPGNDVWIPSGQTSGVSEALIGSDDSELEAFRIFHGVPAWGKELMEGMLPPEARLDVTDISYHKGCYIGQEVISRIKSAGKLNRTLEKLRIQASSGIKDGAELWDGESIAGLITSVSPLAEGASLEALGYVKRTADRSALQVKSDAGTVHAVSLR